MKFRIPFLPLTTTFCDDHNSSHMLHISGHTTTAHLSIMAQSLVLGLSDELLLQTAQCPSGDTAQLIHARGSCGSTIRSF